jgi:hypothetical protein
MDVRFKATGGTGKFHPFEVASLANLAAGGGIADEEAIREAVTWIPSLSAYEEESLQLALEYIARAKSRLEVMT